MLRTSGEYREASRWFAAYAPLLLYGLSAA